MSKAKSSDGLLIGIGASLALLVLSYVRIAGDAGSAYFAGGGLVESAFGEEFWGSVLASKLLRFAVTLLLLHVLLGGAAWLLGRASRCAWRAQPHSARTWTLLWVLAFSAWVLFANAAFFPASSLGESHGAIVATLGGETAARVFGIALAIAAVVTLLKAAVASRRAMVWVGGTGAAVAMVGLLSGAIQRKPISALDHERPHVILIGLDSMRPDFVRSTEGRRHFPNLNAFFDSAAEFTDTLTPLARTFPSWVSVISGKHPRTTGAIANLLPRELIHEGATLPKLLRAAGYRTVYATDEVRFSNLDETFGFEKVVSPPMGAADFLLSFFGDTPLANLIANQPIGRTLFPHAHANRGAAVTYEPDAFVNRLDAAVTFQAPTFLAVHLTLVHWPYTWATGNLEGDLRAQYIAAAARLDRQFSDIVQSLQKKGALTNALVVVFSDHGESLGENPAALLGYDVESLPAIEISSGHGTNALADYQYHVLLGIRSFGSARLETRAATIDSPTSVEDITPTILEALDLKAEATFDGISLLSLIAGEKPASTLRNRVRYVETGFNPPQFDPEHISAARALRSAGSFYRVDPQTDRVELRPDLLDEILAMRQYAALKAGNKLVAIPAGPGEPGYHLLHVESSDGKAYWLERAPRLGEGEAAEGLWQALTARFPHLGTARIFWPPALEAPSMHGRHD